MNAGNRAASDDIPGERGPSRTRLGWIGELSRVTRLTARRELIAAAPLAVMGAVLTGPFCGFVAYKGLEAPEVLVTTILACNMLGMMLGGTMAGLLHHRPKVACLKYVLLGISVIMLTISVTPWAERHYHVGAYVFLGQIFLAQLGLGMMITLRSAVWRTNYPTAHRGKIVMVIGLAMAVANFVAITLFTAGMDHLSISFGNVYVISGVFGIFSAFLMGRIRLHRERQILRGLTENSARRPHILAGLAVLRTDRRFRRYMSWQMFSGFSTMIVETILVFIVTDVFASNWLEGGSALAAIPMLVAGASSPFWAGLFDRTDIFRMRFYGALAWALSRVMLGVAVLMGSMELLFVSRVLAGTAMGGGMIAWRLGHMAFAPVSEDSLYMGAHIGLTGLRGIVAPFIGVALYRLDILGPHGVWLIFMSAGCQCLAGMAFRRMGKDS